MSTSSTSATIILYIDPVLPRPLPTIARGVHAPHAHGSVRAARRSDRAAERDLWTCSACVKCSAERAETDGMMQVGEKAQTAAQGTANPACGSRGMSCDFAVLHAFGCRELKKNQTSRMDHGARGFVAYPKIKRWGSLSRAGGFPWTRGRSAWIRFSPFLLRM